MSVREEVDPTLVTLEDEFHGGLIASRWTGQRGSMRKKGRNLKNNRNPFLMGQMKARMAALWANGDTYVQITERINNEFELQGEDRIKVDNIHYHIKNMLAYWREKGLISIDERQAMILARYDQLEQIAMEAYFASCEGKTTENFKKQVHRARSRDREKQLLKAIKRERAAIKNTKAGSKKTQLLAMVNDTGDLTDNMEEMSKKVEKYRRRESNPAGDPRWIQLLIDINDKRAKLWGLHTGQTTSNPDHEMARLSDEQRENRMAAILQQAKARREKNQGNLAPAQPLGGFKKKDGPIEPEVLPPDESWNVNNDEDDIWE